MTSEDGLPFLTERQLIHSQSNDIETRVTFVCIEWPAADYEPFFGLRIAHDLHHYLEACETFQELCRVGREIPIFVCGRLEQPSYSTED